MNVMVWDEQHKQLKLLSWLEDCKTIFQQRYPTIDFESNVWNFAQLYSANILTNSKNVILPKCLRFAFNPTVKKFENKHISFVTSLKCIACELLFENELADFKGISLTFDIFSELSIYSIFELEQKHLHQIEKSILRKTESNPIKAESMIRSLRHFESIIIPRLRKNDVSPHLFYKKDVIILNSLLKLRADYLSDKANHRKNSDDRLARVAATSDAISASFRNDDRLSEMDHLVCCTLVVLFVAPSRINEPLNMSIDDVIEIESYLDKGAGQIATNNAAHRQLFVAMKGSKGAKWAPKPALSFMHDLLKLAIERIKKFGVRSRLLLEHYENNPNQLYLPKELKYLATKDFWSYEDITRVVRLDGKTPYSEMTNIASFIAKIRALNIDGTIETTRMHQRTFLFPREPVVQYLLNYVHVAIEKCKREGDRSVYLGKLSRKLFLCDVSSQFGYQFAPDILRYSVLSRRLIQRMGPKSVVSGTIFQKLGLKVPSGNNVIDAWINTHEARHFLSDSARKYGDNLSDALINKWARRLDIKQLDHYISDDPKFDADRSVLPEIGELKEFADVSDSLNQANDISAEMEIETGLIKLNETPIRISSVDAVVKAVEIRPAARVSNKLIILYPSQFGICLHQHHEVPCMNYGMECMGCNDNVTIKGHIPTNDAVRKELTKLQSSVLRQLDRLVTEHNRNIADDQETFSDHITKLIEGSLNTEVLANHLIDEFHTIKDQLKDKNLARRLEQAFVAKKTVQFLDDDRTMIGGIIKYHNPHKDGRSDVNKSELFHGGWEKVWEQEQLLAAEYPFLQDQGDFELKDQSEEFDDAADDNDVLDED
ncbi:MAG: hypothetical protein CTY35_07520 [Methylotenera sp.]|nr:MAG: hypothetical protein CTY35_07520 [Methylotenera sp.]PPD49850.1 MAG: hypothetical protein CTY12_10315 [Methylotenera sp.]